MQLLYLILVLLRVSHVITDDFIDSDELLIDIDLPESHLSQYFNNLPDFAKKVNETSNGLYKEFLSSEKYDREACWGYEHRCKKPRLTHRCPGHHSGYVKSKEAQLEVFYAQTDFGKHQKSTQGHNIKILIVLLKGYIKNQLQELTLYCEPTFVTDSSLECTKYARFCRGRNLMLNFTDLVHRKEPMRYATDVLKGGEIGGYCKFNEVALKEQLDHLSALQSWAPELRFFESMSQRPIENDLCDVVIDKPTYIMKIDSAMNMYHHFCDFFNLYAAQHLNFSRPGAFSTDINILIWESYTYFSPFSKTLEAFTENPLWDLNTFR